MVAGNVTLIKIDKVMWVLKKKQILLKETKITIGENIIRLNYN